MDQHTQGEPGSYDGFREFVTARLGALSRVAYLLTADHHAAEDLLQDTLMRVALRWRHVSSANDPMAYVWRILYREHITRWRRAHHLRRELRTSEPPDSVGVDESGDAIKRIVVEQALARLTPRQRAVIVLRFYEDLAETETAAVLGCSVGTVMGR